MANAQRARASLDMLFKKKPREATHDVEVTVDDGTTQVVEMLLRSIGMDEYDKLLTAHPPTQAQKKDGANYNQDTFAPELISRVVVDPEISVEDAKTLWKSPDWNRGELFQLFSKCIQVCNSGVDIFPTSEDSE